MQHHEPLRFTLTTRIRAGIAEFDGCAPLTELANRLAGLPGVRIDEYADEAGKPTVDARIRNEVTRLGEQPPENLVCRFHDDSIVVFGLGTWEKHQVLSGGWGHLRARHVHLHVPRNVSELEVCWSILRQAYDSFSHSPATSRLHRGTVPSWPRYSRTNIH